MSESDQPDYSNIARILGEALITMRASMPQRPLNVISRRYPYTPKNEYLIYDQQFQLYTLPEHGISFEKNKVLLKTWYPEIGNKLHSLPRIHLDDMARATGYKKDFIAAEYYNWYFRDDDLKFPIDVCL